MKLQIVSNRLPVKIKRKGDELKLESAAGGLATGLKSLTNKYKMAWTGWPGINDLSDEEKAVTNNLLEQNDLSPVYLSKEEHENYYEGFSNKMIWPLFHYFCQFAEYNKEYWEAYKRANRRFCDKLLEKASEGDTFWIHDYHLMLLPQMIREKLPEAKIGFFLHIPFPHYEVFRNIIWREDILRGLSGADLIGFHTREYADYFLDCVSRICKARVDRKAYRLENNSHVTKAAVFPMGIDYKKFASKFFNHMVINTAKKYKKQFSDKTIMLSIDRLDYSKGVVQRLKAFDLFLEQNPQFREQISFLILLVPSRTGVEQYQQLKEEIDEYIGKINGRYGSPFWTPVQYFYRSMNINGLCALYSIADIALVTPFRDGMNLVAKEYVATRQNGHGALILSEFAGAARELKEALTVNPNSLHDMVNAIKKAMLMSDEEKMQRMRKMQKRLARKDIKEWAGNFIQQLQEDQKEVTTVGLMGRNNGQPAKRVEIAERRQETEVRR